MLPVFAGLINLIPGVANTILSIIREKKNTNPATSAVLPAFVADAHNIADGIELSSKAIVGYGVGGAIVYFALQQDPLNLYVLAIGAVVVIATTVAKVFDKK